MRFLIRDHRVVTVGQAPDPLPQGNGPEEIYRYFREVVAGDPAHEPDKEHLVVLLMNTRLEVFGWHLACLGTVNEVTFHPREILRPAILACAGAFALAHNHPSGDPAPSMADERSTRRLIEAADILQLRFLDHVIVGRPSPGREAWFSFRERGIIV